YKARKIAFKLGTGDYNGAKEITKTFSLAGVRGAAGADAIASVVLALDGLLEYELNETTVQDTDTLVI
ncbi:MAG: hypothetical protein LBL05_03735, partial [Synergistaceae bacterium]|nr:hypothetical protein [Synergistaceae bacterium]